jgi:antitoxin CcdA
MSELNERPKRRSVNLTIREDLISDAKALGLNASKAAEAGITEAVRRAREKQWLEENREAIEAYNKRIRDHGPILGSPYWSKD